MKAVLASVLTALVLVSAAWASNVTPGQLAALSRRVTKLEQSNAKFSTEIAGQSTVIACLQRGWNAQHLVSYTTASFGGFDTPSGSLGLFVSPNAADGTVGTGYLVSSPGDGTSQTC